MAEATRSQSYRWAVLGFIAVWMALQILVPLRHLLYPGNVSWTEEGHRFSWQMKLRDKKTDAIFIVTDPTNGNEMLVYPEMFLLRHQQGMVSRPDMVLQFAHYLADVFKNEFGFREVEVRAEVCTSLNGRPAAPLIDPSRDLTKIKRSLDHADWILPLTQPFERPPYRKIRRDRSCDVWANGHVSVQPDFPPQIGVGLPRKANPVARKLAADPAATLGDLSGLQGQPA